MSAVRPHRNAGWPSPRACARKIEVAHLINCECGCVARAGTEDVAIDPIQDHSTDQLDLLGGGHTFGPGRVGSGGLRFTARAPARG